MTFNRVNAYHRSVGRTDAYAGLFARFVQTAFPLFFALLFAQTKHRQDAFEAFLALRKLD